MASYRVTLTIGRLLPGVAPDSVLPSAADAAGAITTVESRDLAVVRSEARITVRFTADDDRVARSVADQVVEATATRAEVLRAWVTRRDGGTWSMVAF